MQSLKKFNRIGAFLFCFALFSSIGGHWAVMQSVAWAQMLIKNAHSDSMKTAAIKTFDGKHPCQLCKNIKRAKSKEKSKTSVLSFQKNPLPAPYSITTPKPYSYEVPLTVTDPRTNNQRLRISPPTPPPRA